VAARYGGYDSASPLARAQALEYCTLLAGYLLSSQGDRMTAAHGVESRCPFLDNGVVDYAFTLPDEYKLRDLSSEKFILKEAFADAVPASILERPKQPYRAPDCRAFLAQRPPWMREALSPERIEATGVFKPEIAARFLARLDTLEPAAIAPREDQAFLLLLSTQLLHAYFVEDLPQAPLIDTATFAVYEDRRATHAA
jgi:asparagine synthase (glutamine-hydrolysing)